MFTAVVFGVGRSIPTLAEKLFGEQGPEFIKGERLVTLS
tara:strand:+ start:54 stop:170 length:117 start_codon:yes stop_codon:yes gene_type:complete